MQVKFIAAFDIDSIKKGFRGVDDEALQTFGEDVWAHIAVHDHYILDGVVKELMYLEMVMATLLLLNSRA